MRFNLKSIIYVLHRLLYPKNFTFIEIIYPIIGL